MRLHAIIRVTLLLLLPTSSLLPTAPAQALPATLPTQPSQTQPGQTAPPARPAPRAPQPTHHTQILYSGDQLTIHADNSSLNAILREITRQTGMLITGGVAEERVYGNYGPSDTGTVLALLLSGTGSNMLLKESSLDRPLELVLTPRQGGASPPSPAALPSPDDDRDAADLPPQQVAPTPLPGTSPQPRAAPQNNFQPPAAAIIAPDTGPVTTQPATVDTTQQSPNGVKTPQQIYDELMKLKQQQQKPNAQN